MWPFTCTRYRVQPNRRQSGDPYFTLRTQSTASTAGGLFNLDIVNKSGIRVLVVEDYAPWSHLLCSGLESHEEFRIVGVVSSGLQASEKAQELQPDLILLDIGLPGVNGIEAARRIKDVSPKSKILFVSENRDPEIVEEALATGARGYIQKSQAATCLFTAIERIIDGGTFISNESTPSSGDLD